MKKTLTATLLLALTLGVGGTSSADEFPLCKDVPDPTTTPCDIPEGFTDGVPVGEHPPPPFVCSSECPEDEEGETRFDEICDDEAIADEHLPDECEETPESVPEAIGHDDRVVAPPASPVRSGTITFTG